MDIDGKNKHLLFKDKKHYNFMYLRGPSWSPDGKKIIFARIKSKLLWGLSKAENCTSEIMVIDLEKRETMSLLKKGNIDDIFWFSNGEKIIFEYKNAIFSFDINQKKINTLITADFMEKRGFYFCSPSLSPNDNNIAFHSYGRYLKGGIKDGIEVYVMNLKDRKIKRLTTDSFPEISDGSSNVSEEIKEMQPVWLDNERIAFNFTKTSGRGKNFQLYHSIVIINLKTKQRQEIPLPPKFLNDNISFSSDCKRIVFSKGFLPGGDIYVMDITGKNLRNLTNTPKIYEMSPSCRPIINSSLHLR